MPLEVSPARVRLLFLSVLVLYVVQTFVLFRWTEPFPALMLPRFTGTFASGAGTYTGKSVDVQIEFRDGAVERIAPRTLLHSVPSGTVMPIARWVFAAEADRKPRSLSAHRRQTPPARDPDVRAWLRRRLASLFPGREPARLTFDWHEDTYRLAEARVERSRRQLNSVVFELAHGQ